MTQIDKTKPVLVTGANGFVASWLVKKLLEEGITVHAAVRDPDDENKVGHLKKVAESAKGSLLFFKADLLTPDAYLEAMQGCELVFHTASPFTLAFKDPQKDLIDPAVKGTENVLQCAGKTPSVKRVVLTSSCAAIYTDAIDTVNAPNGELTEAIWNTTATLDYQPYSLSKTWAEQKAWELAGTQSQWDLVVINPSFVVGPPLNPKNTSSETVQILKSFGNGQMRFGTPNLGMGLVDVRDVAEAHFKAGYTPLANGRYITSGHNTNFLEMARTLQEKYSVYPLPKKAMPRWLLLLVGPLVDKSLTKRFIRNNVNIPWKANHSKIVKDLGMQFRPLKESMTDAFQSLIDAGILQKK